MRRTRRILVPLVALGAATAVTATAFACTVYQGKLTLKGNAASSTVQVVGNGTGMGFKSVSPGIAKAKRSGGRVYMAAGPDPTKSSNKLPAGTYNVRFFNSVYVGSTAVRPGFSNHTTWTTDCGSSRPPVVTLGTVTIGAAGTIVSGQPSTGFALGNSPTGGPLTPDQAPAESAICLLGPSSRGIQAPLTIL